MAIKAFAFRGSDRTGHLFRASPFKNFSLDALIKPNSVVISGDFSPRRKPGFRARSGQARRWAERRPEIFDLAKKFSLNKTLFGKSSYIVELCLAPVHPHASPFDRDSR